MEPCEDDPEGRAWCIPYRMPGLNCKKEGPIETVNFPWPANSDGCDTDKIKKIEKEKLDKALGYTD